MYTLWACVWERRSETERARARKSKSVRLYYTHAREDQMRCKCTCPPEIHMYKTKGKSRCAWSEVVFWRCWSRTRNCLRCWQWVVSPRRFDSQVSTTLSLSPTRSPFRSFSYSRSHSLSRSLSLSIYRCTHIFIHICMWLYTIHIDRVESLCVCYPKLEFFRDLLYEWICTLSQVPRPLSRWELRHCLNRFDQHPIPKSWFWRGAFTSTPEHH